MSLGIFFGIISQFLALFESKVGIQIGSDNFFEVTFKSPVSFFGFCGKKNLIFLKLLDYVRFNIFKFA